MGRYANAARDEADIAGVLIRMVRQKNGGKPGKPGELSDAFAAYYAGTATPDVIEAVMQSARVWVYLAFFGIEPGRAEFLKIGIAKDVDQRLAGHRTSNPMHNTLTLSAPLDCRAAARAVEVALLKHMAAHRVSGEWIKCKASLDVCRAIAASLAEVASQVEGEPVEFKE